MLALCLFSALLVEEGASSFILFGRLVKLTVIDSGVAGSRPIRCVWTKFFALSDEGIVWNVMWSSRTFEKDFTILNE